MSEYSSSCILGLNEEVSSSGPLLDVDYAEMYCTSSHSVYSLLMLLWVVALISFLGSTAGNYLSPTLTNICENLNLSYNVAGVTFLAFGNGAPDVFSSLSSFTASEETSMIGINASLGASVFICTVLVGSVAIICPCFVSRETFLRDISFHLIAVLTISVVAIVKNIYIGTAMILFFIYSCYVITILVLSRMANRRAQEAVRAGKAARKNIRKIKDDNASTAPLKSFGNAVQQAYWYKSDNLPRKEAPSSSSNTALKAPASSTTTSGDEAAAATKGVGKTGYTFLILDEDERDDDDDNDDNNNNLGGSNGTGAGGGGASKGKGKGGAGGSDNGSISSDSEDEEITINLSGGLMGGTFAGEILENYIPLPTAAEVAAAQRSPARTSGGRMMMGGEQQYGGGPSLLQDALRMFMSGGGGGKQQHRWERVAGDDDDASVMHNPLTDDLLAAGEDDDDAMQQYHHSRALSMGTGQFRNDSVDIELQDTMTGAPVSPFSTPPRIWASSSSTRGGRGGAGQGQAAADDLYWQRWYMRHRLRRHFGNSEFWGLPWHQRLLWAIEMPVSFLRDITIPTLEDSAWSKNFALMHPVGIALLSMRVFGASFTVGSVVITLLICTLPTLAIFLATQNSKPPQQSMLRVLWTLAGFYSCIMWVYMLAGELIVCLEVLGAVWRISPAYLGLTVLAWGNSIGDLFSIVALARRGLGEMAFAGCYGSEVFNLLFGLGLAMGAASLDCYPHPFHIAFNASSYISLAFCIVALVSTLVIVPLRGWKIEQSFGFYLISLYAAYTAVQMLYLIES